MRPSAVGRSFREDGRGTSLFLVSEGADVVSFCPKVYLFVISILAKFALGFARLMAIFAGFYRKASWFFARLASLFSRFCREIGKLTFLTFPFNLKLKLL